MDKKKAELSSVVFDDSFRARFCFDFPPQESCVQSCGHSFPIIGYHKAGWHDVRENFNNGFLRQIGDITIINPDHHADIAFLHLSLTHYLYFHQNRFDTTDECVTKLMVFPRDPNTLQPNYKPYSDPHEDQEPVVTFGEALLQEIPGAPFAEGIKSEFKKLAGLYLPHRDFVERQIKRQAAPCGLVVFKATKDSVTRPEVCEKLFMAPMLSHDPTVREGFAQLVQNFIRPQQTLTTATNEKALGLM